jgi:hypothetical protein
VAQDAILLFRVALRARCGFQLMIIALRNFARPPHCLPGISLLVTEKKEPCSADTYMREAPKDILRILPDFSCKLSVRCVYSRHDRC